MPKVVFFNTYELKKGASVPDFLLAVETLKNNYISKQKGYLSFQLLAEGESWADATSFETEEDAKGFAEAAQPNEYAEAFYSFLNFETCQSHFYTVERE